MSKSHGFLQWSRQLPARRPVAERLRDWREVERPQTPEQTQEQAGRCMDCGVPFCHQGCPLGNRIPDWNELVHRDRWREAYRRLAATNNFPEFTGRLCPAPCEAACVLGLTEEAVTIEMIERAIAEHAFAHGWVVPEPPAARTGKHVAVVGSGPAGLAAAAQLNSIGHRVTVYESAEKVGGLLRYGIPDFKMEKSVLDRRIAIMEAEGIEFRVGVTVGDSPGWNELVDDHDAVLIAIGSRRPRDLEVPGRRELSGIVFAMDYLTQQNRLEAGEPSADERIDAAGKRVVILGGGDTGSDCLGTALRQNAASVTQIELLPAPPTRRAADNPWPQWPLLYRTSSSQEEGGQREFALMTTRLEGEGGVLDTLHAIRVDLERTADGPRLREFPDQRVEIAVDLLILAMGFIGPEVDGLVDQLGVERDRRGNIKTDENYATSRPEVFCAGDARRGQSLIVWAISEGREAARAIDSRLRAGRDDQPSRLPTRGVDQPFGGR